VAQDGNFIHDKVNVAPVSSLQLFLLAAVGSGAILIGLAVVAPPVSYRWTSARRRLLGRWRTEMALIGLAIILGTTVSLLFLLLLGGGA
jgi:hypothetical protein